MIYNNISENRKIILKRNTLLMFLNSKVFSKNSFFFLNKILDEKYLMIL